MWNRIRDMWNMIKLSSVTARFSLFLAVLREWAHPNPLRPDGYQAGHRRTRRTPIHFYASEIVYRYRVQHGYDSLIDRVLNSAMESAA